MRWVGYWTACSVAFLLLFSLLRNSVRRATQSFYFHIGNINMGRHLAFKHFYTESNDLWNPCSAAILRYISRHRRDLD